MPPVPSTFSRPQPMAAEVHFPPCSVGHHRFVFDLGRVDRRAACLTRLAASVPRPSLGWLFRRKRTVRELGADSVGEAGVWHGPFLLGTVRATSLRGCADREL